MHGGSVLTRRASRGEWSSGAAFTKERDACVAIRIGVYPRCFVWKGGVGGLVMGVECLVLK